jgi:DNA-binding NarL/FixJ family response regulator
LHQRGRALFSKEIALRIILVDSSEVFRMGMRALLSDARDLVVTGEAVDAASALAAVRANAPDLVVTDLELPDETGVTLASAVREVSHTTRVLVLAAMANEVSVRQAAVAGVSGYVLKSQPPREIVAAVREAGAGRQIEPPPTREASRAADETQVARASRASVLERLSAREREIFDLIIWGQTNKQVAGKLGISVKTVETHRSHINGKLQVHSAAELVRLASLCGVLAAGEGGAAAAGSTVARPTPDKHDKPLGKNLAEGSPLPRLVAKIG